MQMWGKMHLQRPSENKLKKMIDLMAVSIYFSRVPLATRLNKYERALRSSKRFVT